VKMKHLGIKELNERSSGFLNVHFIFLCSFSDPSMLINRDTASMPIWLVFNKEI
jgi:hypothetical protein